VFHEGDFSMRILVVGATGTIGRAVVAALSSGNEIVPVSRQSTTITVDLADPASIREMYRLAGTLDAVVCAAGLAKFAPLAQLGDTDFRFCLDNKLMGQVNLVRYGFEHVADRGSFTLTSGILARTPMPGSAAISLVNAGVEGFARAAALEAPRGIRVNVVSPPWVSETLQALKMDPSQGLPAAVVARSYVQSVTGTHTGSTLEPPA
jgi:NAD(P)-dependent dehydrogenase (short-subunit alcohol dehydrogenase family)